MAKEKRSSPRVKRRLLVRFGERDLSKSGFTADVSATGLFAATSPLPPIDARLHLQLIVDDNHAIYIEARVKRHRVIPVELRTVEKGGFGVRFLTPGEALEEILPGRSVRETLPRYQVDLLTPEELKQLHDRELRHGGIFISTSDSLANDEVAEIEFRIDFPPGPLELVFPAKVVHVVGGSIAFGAGIGFEFLNRPGVLEKLAPFLV